MARRTPLQRVEVLSARITAAEAEREQAIAAAVADGATWAQIGQALGVSA